MVINMKLRRLEEKDAAGILEWMKDARSKEFFRIDFDHVTLDSIRLFILESHRLWDTDQTYHYAIANDRDEYIGTISLKNIDHAALTAEYAVSIRYTEMKKGYATNATRELLRIAFEERKLNRIYLSVLSDNEAAKRLYGKLGFRYEGEFRDHIMINGKLRSWCWYGMLKTDYDSFYRGKSW